MTSEPEFTVIVPVYKKSDYVFDIIDFFKKYDNVEILVSVELPEKDFLQKLKKIGAKIDVSYKRRGKVGNVNSAVDKSKGKYLIFLDDDVRILKFDIKKLKELFNKYDIVDFAKINLNKDLLNRIEHYETLNYDFIQDISTRFDVDPLILMGCGFAVKKEVFVKLGKYGKFVTEDFEFIVKAVLNGYKRTFSKDHIISIKAIDSLSKFLEQRKRWSYGMSEVLRKYYKELIDYFILHPILFLIYIISTFYTLLLFIYILFTRETIKKLIFIILFFLMLKFPIISITLWPYILHSNVIEYTLLILVPLTINGYFLYSIAKELKTRFNIFEYLAYYLFFLPAFVFIGVITIIFSTVFKKVPKMDWKV